VPSLIILAFMIGTMLIIGAGQAGSQAAATLRGEGFMGRIVLVGAEPYFPYQRPPLSKQYLATEMDRGRLLLRPETFYSEQRIEVKTGVKATALDRANKVVTLSDASSERYDKLLLATGARVRKLTLPHSDLKEVLYLRSIGDVEVIRSHIKPGKRVALIGGGYVGLEVAAVAVKLGATVTVIEMAQRLMARTASEPTALFYEQEHQKNGVTIKVNAMCQSFEESGGRLTRVRLADGSAVDADVAIVGVGVEPETGIAKEAGIVCENGILVDECGQTSDPDIFAAGDCTNHPNPFVGGMIRLESVQNAIDQAKHAALAMIGQRKPYGEVPWFWSDQYDLKFQSAGVPRGHDEIVTRGDPTRRSFAVFYLKGGQILAVEAVNAVPEYMFGKRMIAQRKHVTAARLMDTAVTMKEIAA
jgi:3-phenylpropionate/trans-cinnamate dioxygenase ferredoxin reductase component